MGIKQKNIKMNILTFLFAMTVVNAKWWCFWPFCKSPTTVKSPTAIPTAKPTTRQVVPTGQTTKRSRSTKRPTTTKRTTTTKRASTVRPTNPTITDYYDPWPIIVDAAEVNNAFAGIKQELTSWASSMHVSELHLTSESQCRKQ